MSKYFYLLLTLLILMLISCNEKVHNIKEQKFIKTISINPTKNNLSKLSDILSQNYKIISLESNENSLIGKIDKIVFLDSKIFILDKDKTKSIFIFNNNGKYESKISRFGEGPNQYIELGDFYIDSITKTVNILNTFPARLMTYDYLGNFLAEKRIADFACQIAINSDSNFCLYLGNNITSETVFHDLIIQNNNNEIVAKYFPIDSGDQSKAVMIPSNFCSFGDSLSFIRPFSDTVFDITTNDMKTKFVFDFGKHNMPNDFFKNKNLRSNIPRFFNKAQKLINKNQYASDIQPYYESEFLIYFSFLFQNKKNYSFYSKKSKKVYHTNLIRNDIIPIKISKVIKVKKKQLITIVDAYEFKNGITNFYNELNKTKKKHFFKSNSKLVLTAVKIKNTDNPILIVYNIKESF